jgi:uncharacterized protein (DUF4213/DUF364 family)
MLGERLLTETQGRTIQRIVAGDRFCAIALDDGGVGLANTCPDACGQPAGSATAGLPAVGTSVAEALSRLSSPDRSAVGLATANALANRYRSRPDPWEQMSVSGDVLDVVELAPDDHVGMVGCFYPLVDRIRQRVGRLFIFERGARLAPDLLPEDRAVDVLARCSVALITATTLINGTIDALLAAAAGCREVVLLGPSTPLVPEVFARFPRRVTLLAGVVVTDPETLLNAVAQGGGTRDFRDCVAKVNIRVGEAGWPAPLA